RFNDRIQTLSFKTYSPTATLEERLAGLSTDELQQVFRRAAEMRKADTELTYWESTLIAASELKQSELLIKEALKHDITDEAIERFELESGNECFDILPAKLKTLSDNEVIA